MRASKTREIRQGIRVLFPLGSFKSFLNKLPIDLYLDQPLRALYMARSLEWTSPCKQGKKLKDLFHEIYQNSNSKTVLTKEGRFFKTC